MTDLRFTRASTASPERVFDVLADGAGWSTWAGPLIPWSGWEREGDPAPGGVGAIRVLGSAKRGTREEIVRHDLPHELAYTILSGLPVRDYVGTIRFVPTGDGGCVIDWSATFAPAVPGTGPLVKRFLLTMLGGFARRAAQYAETSA